MKRKTIDCYIIVFMGFLVLFVGNYPQYQMSALSHILISSMGLDTGQFSSIFSASMIPGIFLSLVSGILCDRFGMRRSIGTAAVLAAVGLTGRIFAADYTTLFVCMVFSGIGSAFMMPNLNKMLSVWFPKDRIGQMTGILMAGVTTAQCVGMGTTAYFPSITSAFVFTAALAIAVAAAWFWLVKDVPEEKAHTDAPKEAVGSIRQGLTLVLQNRGVWLIGLGLMCAMGNFVGLIAFLPLALQEGRGFSTEVSGLLSSVVMAGSFAGTLINPVIYEKFGCRKGYLCVLAVLEGLGTVFVWRLPTGAFMRAALFAVGFAANGIVPILVAAVSRLDNLFFSCYGMAGGVTATLQLAGAVIIPTYIVMPIAGDSYGWYFLFCGVIAIFGGMFSLLLLEKKI